MRDIAITLFVIIGCFYTLKRAYIGVLLWSWLSYMNPHRLSYGFAYTMPFAQITAIVLLISMLFSKEKKGVPITAVTSIWIVFLLYMGLTTFFAYFPDEAIIQYKKVLKIQFITFLTMMLITDMEKLKKLIWVIVLSIGFFSIKGGIFTLLTGGAYRVWGPPGSYIEDNNGLAIAILMVIPLMVYLSKTAENLWVKKGMQVSIVTSLFTVLGSQSRGALIAIATVGIFYWIKSKSKLITGLFISIMAFVLLAFMPETWFNRMNTIETYDEDASAMGRLNAWEYAFHAANDNLFGVGFDAWSYETFLLYAPNPEDVHAAHSIYFSILADHGWLGLIMFLLIFIISWQKIKKIIRKTEGNEALFEQNTLARMLQISFLAYLSGGAFLSLSYFDLPWHLVSFVVILEIIIKKIDTKPEDNKLANSV